MSKMEDVAKLLGVSLNQFFRVCDDDGFASDEIFWLSEDGLCCLSMEDRDVDDIDHSYILMNLLTGDTEVAQIAIWEHPNNIK